MWEDVVKIRFLYAIFLMMFFSYIKSFIFKFIVALLGLGLVLSLGVGSDIISFGMSDNVIASINKQDITLEEFNYFRRARYLQIPKKLLGDKKALEIIDKEIIDTIARRKSSSIEATSLGLYVSDAELKEKISDTELFKRGGSFIGFDSYEEKVKNVFGLNVEVFEEILKEEILNDKLKFYITSFIYVSQKEVEVKYRDDSSKLNFYIIRPNTSNQIVRDFTEDEIVSFIESKKNSSDKSNFTYMVTELDYEYLTQDVKISQKDIDTFVLNYSSNDSDIPDEDARKLIRQRIALNIFPKKYQYFSTLAETKNFDEIVEEAGLIGKVKSFSLDLAAKSLPEDLLKKIRASNFDQSKAYVHFSGDAIYLVSVLNRTILTRQQAKAALNENYLLEYENRILGDLLKIDKSNNRLVFESIKNNSDYTYEYNYNLSFGDFNKVLGSKIDFDSLKEEVFVNQIIYDGSERFIIFIEKIRKADQDFLLLDKDKIVKDLSLYRKEKIYRIFLSEIFDNSIIKYNKKYID
jgi:hypothetical protein